ncbi:hypothetical protein SKAU_G00410520 [Synaphobranchus kaupii]|uniref:Uncharacterized protein n=1 Tax=Synaphobranchus kaupii TaxID=118154 RepID=A0A9Q1I9R5_SYNKA|nr:hypothetical protein SKAU_G00410520 [Synaphobranchus kaupii]
MWRKSRDASDLSSYQSLLAAFSTAVTAAKAITPDILPFVTSQGDQVTEVQLAKPSASISSVKFSPLNSRPPTPSSWELTFGAPVSSRAASQLSIEADPEGVPADSVHYLPEFVPCTDLLALYSLVGTQSPLCSLVPNFVAGPPALPLERTLASGMLAEELQRNYRRRLAGIRSGLFLFQTGKVLAPPK